MEKLNASARILAARKLTAEEEKWSKDVKTKEHPPENLFKDGSAGEIASWIHKSHDDLQSAMGSLNFYRNRAGKNLSSERKGVLDSVEGKLEKMYGGSKKD